MKIKNIKKALRLGQWLQKYNLEAEIEGNLLKIPKTDYYFSTLKELENYLKGYETRR